MGTKQKRAQAARQRRNRNIAIATAAVLIGVLGSVWFIGSQNHDERLAIPQRTTVNGLPQNTPDELQLLSQYEAGLALLAQRSESARTYYEYFKAMAVRCSWDPGTEYFRNSEAPRTKPFIPVVPLPHGAGQLGVPATALGGYNQQGKYLLLMPSSHGPLGKGLVLFHEMFHAQQCLAGSLPFSNPKEDNYYLADAQAYWNSTGMLGEYTGGKWIDVVYATTQDRQSEASNAGDKRFMYTAAELQRVRDCLGPLDADEENLFILQLLHSVNLKLIADRYGFATPAAKKASIAYFRDLENYSVRKP